MCGFVGFQLTALTVPECPGSTFKSLAVSRCHMYTWESYCECGNVERNTFTSRDDKELIRSSKSWSNDKAALFLSTKLFHQTLFFQIPQVNLLRNRIH